MSVAGLLNTVWMVKSAREAWTFQRATRQVGQTQAAVLLDILRHNQETEFGHAHRFSHIRAPQDYQRRVPLSTYEDYAEAVQRLGTGAAGILTQERVELLEPTSGTTRGEKLIPYTASLRRQFQRAVAAWIANLLWHRPAVRSGRAYWSISPALTRGRQTVGGIPIGFDDDAAYLGLLEQLALDRLRVVPASVARLNDLEAFRYATLRSLLRAEDLALISIWNPTFLTSLLASLEPWQDRLLADLRADDEPRALHLHVIFRKRLSGADTLRLVWPRLALISCWTDAAAAHCLPELRELFPTVEIQPKGLLATEGCVTFPLVGRPAPVLAIRSHFFEFQERDGSAHCRLAHELDQGGRYRVVLTTGGGLYRYQLRDEVEVVGFENQCPLLRFLGKADRASDLVGEKLAEPHVRSVLDRLLARHGLTPRFALLVPVVGRPAHYRLYLQGPGFAGNLPALAAELEAGLSENPHYGYAVQLGQLAPVEIELLDPAAESGWRVYERCCLARGQRAGNIKPTVLDAWTGWPEALQQVSLPSPQYSGERGWG